MAAELEFATTIYKQPAGTDGINDWMELNSTPPIEVFRVTSSADGDYIFCKKINRVKSVIIQNHGATFGTGANDPPKVTVTNGSGTSNAKITIGHTATQEVFSLLVVGEL